MAQKDQKARPASDGLWLHVYGILPPQPRNLFRKIASLLGAEDRVAQDAGRAWTGSLVTETRGGPVSHVLIVSDSTARDDLIHVTLEAEMKKLGVDIFIHAPMRVPDRAV